MRIANFLVSEKNLRGDEGGRVEFRNVQNFQVPCYKTMLLIAPTALQNKYISPYATNTSQEVHMLITEYLHTIVIKIRVPNSFTHATTFHANFG